MRISYHRGKPSSVRVFLALLAALLASEVQAQALDVTRPGDRPLRLPELPSPEGTGPLDFELPELPDITPAKPDPAAARLFLKAVIFEGNKALSDADLDPIAAPFVGRSVTAEELQELRRLLTRAYVEQGYVNSGALLPDQEVADGLVTYRIVEGRLEEIEVTGTKRLKADYLAARLRLAVGPPLNVNELRDRLQILLQDPRIRRIGATLLPGLRPGESRLRVAVEEAPAGYLQLSLDNDHSPSSGAFGGSLTAGHLNLLGFGDSLEVSHDRRLGFEDLNLAYSLPLTPHDTRLTLRGEISESEVLEEPFDALDIESESRSLEIALSQPIHITPNEQLLLSLSFARRHSETSLLGRPFSFEAGADRGKTDVSVLSLAQEWTRRDLNQVLTARSSFNVGLPILGASDSPGNTPDGEAFYWLGQAQWFRRFDYLDSELLLRSDLQLAADPLLSMEQFAVGGAGSVRGYRNNLLVRDNGWVSSLELRLPAAKLSEAVTGAAPTGSFAELTQGLKLAGFADFGWSWNSERPTNGSERILGLGLGLLWQPAAGIDFRFYKGFALANRPDPNDENLQDDGFHFSLTLNWPIE